MPNTMSKPLPKIKAEIARRQRTKTSKPTKKIKKKKKRISRKIYNSKNMKKLKKKKTFSSVPWTISPATISYD